MGNYSIYINWMEEFKNNPNKWENIGRQTAEENCTHKTQDKDSNKENRETNLRYSGWCEECDIYKDSCEPMMNYAFSLICEPTKENILKVIKETCLTIMYNTETDEYFLVLCGGGMDLSQSIGLAYLFTDGRIPKDLISVINTQKGLSVGGKNWEFLRDSIIKQLKNDLENEKNCLKKWEEIKN